MLKDLHGFRGFAIINIVLAHTGGALLISQYFMGEKVRSPSWDNTFGLSEMLFHDSTIYFAVISGLLFSLVLFDKGWLRFAKGKLCYVLLPYLLMSAIFTVIDYSWMGEGFILFPFDSFYAFLKIFVKNLMLGTADPQYWYIPTLFCLFFLTPVLWFLGQRSLWFLVALSFLPFVSAREATDLSVQTVSYFLGAYATGMAVGMHYERTMLVIKQRRWLFGLVAIATSIVLFVLVRKTEPMAKLGLLVESLFYVQKLSIAAVTLFLLKQYQDRIPVFLNVLGMYAFPVYFVHFFFVRVFTVNIFEFIPPPYSNLVNLAVSVVSIVVVLGFSVLVAIGIKKICGRYSRFVAGA